MPPHLVSIFPVLALWVIVAGWLVALLMLVLTDRVTPDLSDDRGHAFVDHEPHPRVTAIVPARNEAAAIEGCVRSLLGQQGVMLRVIAVDDRSEDETGALLEALAREDARLTVLRVTHLPPGWLGKNHANHIATQYLEPHAVEGEVLLFTDGDVTFEPEAMGRAVGLMRAHGLGHLAVSPRLIAHGFWEKAFQATFAWMFALRFRLWRLQVSRSRAYVGIGACNLVRRADYERIGGHRPLAMEVVDDVKMGLLLRRAGVPQGLASGHTLVSVHWQPGFRASLRGLQKNLFAGAGWRWRTVLGGSLTILLPVLLPWLALMPVFPVEGFLQGTEWANPRIPALLGVLLPMVAVGSIARRLFGDGANRPTSGLEGLAAPVVLPAFIGALLVSAALATIRGGIVWRGTFYPLAELRAGCIQEREYPPDRAPGWPVAYPPRSGHG